MLWVEISGAGYPESFEETPLYDGRANVITQVGHANLGVHACVGDCQDNMTCFGYCVAGSAEIIGNISPNDFAHDAFDVAITHDFYNLQEFGSSYPFVSRAAFGFCFRRYASSKLYFEGHPTPQYNRVDEPDDSVRAFQDVDPDYDPTGGDMLIIDGDAPSMALSVQHSGQPSFSHLRINFVEHVVFNFEPYYKPERCSEKFKWACTMDAGLDDFGEAVFIRGEPNTGSGYNKVVLGDHLEDDSLGLTSAPHLDTANPKTITRGQMSHITVTGTGLIGRFWLEKDGSGRIDAAMVWVKETSTDFSDCTEAKIFFNTQTAPSTGWKLKAFNGAGTSNTLTGFEIVEE